MWQEASIAFPDAQVIHTERPEDEWWTRFNATIGKFFALLDTLRPPSQFAEFFETMKAGVLPRAFGDFTDRESAILPREQRPRARDQGRVITLSTRGPYTTAASQSIC